MNFFFNLINKLYFNNRFEKKLKNTYEILNKQKKINKLYKLKEELQKIKFNKVASINSEFKEYKVDLYDTLNQFIYSRFINRPLFNSCLLFALSKNKSIIYPLPKEYLIKINRIVKVNFYLSSILFYIVIFSYLFLQILKSILNIFLFFKFEKKSQNVYLDAIPKLEINNKESSNFFLWVVQKFSLRGNINFLHCNKFIPNKYKKLRKIYFKTTYIYNPIYLKYSFANLINYIISIFNCLLFLIKLLIFLEFKLAILFLEILNFYFFKKLKKNSNFKLCLFNNSNLLFRPLWTYVNERNFENSVNLFFYSTNIIPLKQLITGEKYYDTYGYSLLKWPSYTVWSLSHKKWLLKYLKDKKVKFIYTKSIPFAGKTLNYKKTKKTLTIFDVPPKRDIIYFLSNNPYNIYTSEYCIGFLKDIINSIPKRKLKHINIIVKMKRIYKNINPKYLNYLKQLSKTKNIKLISDISPEEIINKSDLIISIPFTSPAIISFRQKKNTLFYDPSGKLNKRYLFEKDINLISNSKILKKYIENYL